MQFDAEHEEGMKPSRGTNHVGDNEKVNWATLAKCPVGVAFDSHSANLSREPIVKYSGYVFFGLGYGRLMRKLYFLSPASWVWILMDVQNVRSLLCRYYIMNANGSQSNICNMILMIHLALIE